VGARVWISRSPGRLETGEPNFVWPDKWLQRKPADRQWRTAARRRRTSTCLK